MRLDPLVRDYPAYLDELIEVLAAPATRVYLDTSLLMWLIRLGADARAEFMAWAATRPQGSIRVPVWAAHELQKHLAANTVAVNVTKTIKEAVGKYDEFVGLAAERADDASSRRSGFASRIELLSALSYSHVQVARIAEAVKAEEAQIRVATDEVIAFANSLMLETDLSAVLQKLSVVGQFRYDHRVPPGFQDNKPENRFGDVILWEEILADMAAAARTKRGGVRKAPLARDAVFLSRDKKTDWVSAANWLSGIGKDASKPDRNVDLDVALPHPTLLHEFRQRTGANRVFITHPAFLATTLDLAARRARQPSPSRVWQAATHKLSLVSKLEKRLEAFGEGPIVVEPRGTSPPSEVQELSPAVAVEWAGVTVRQAATVNVAGEIEPVLNALPADAEATMLSLVERAAAGSLEGLRLGRALAELTLARAAGWPEQLPVHLETVLTASISVGQLALVGFAATGLFDRFGEIRTQPAHEILQATLALEDDPRLADAFRTIARLVAEADARLPYVPGSRTDVRYSLDLASGPAPQRVRSIRLGGQSVLGGNLPSASERTLSHLLGRPASAGCSGQELRALIAREYLVPIAKLASTYDGKTITWSEGSGLQPLDTSGDGGIGEDLDTDDYD